jgi:hypothetical protein
MEAGRKKLGPKATIYQCNCHQNVVILFPMCLEGICLPWVYSLMDATSWTIFVPPWGPMLWYSFVFYPKNCLPFVRLSWGTNGSSRHIDFQATQRISHSWWSFLFWKEQNNMIELHKMYTKAVAVIVQYHYENDHPFNVQIGRGGISF